MNLRQTCKNTDDYGEPLHLLLLLKERRERMISLDETFAESRGVLRAELEHPHVNGLTEIVGHRDTPHCDPAVHGVEY